MSMITKLRDMHGVQASTIEVGDRYGRNISAEKYQLDSQELQKRDKKFE